MITPKVTGNKVVFGPVRLSYTHVFEKYSADNNPENGKYQTNFLVPKNEKNTIKAINEAIGNAKTDGVTNKWHGKVPGKLDISFRDGDEKDNDETGLYKGNFYANAKCATRPGLIDKDKTQIVDEEEIYSGCWAILSITFFPYDTNGNKGIACGLNNIMKFKDDEHLGGRVSAESDFGDVEIADDDDL